MLSHVDVRCLSLILLLRIAKWHGWCFFPQQSCLPAFFLADVWLLDDIVDRHCRVHDEISEASLSLWLATERRHLEFHFLRYCLPLLTREVHDLLNNKGRHCPNIQAAVFVLSRRLQGLHSVSVTPESSGFYGNEAHVTLQLVCICVKQNFSRKRCERVLLENVCIADHQPLTTAR